MEAVCVFCGSQEGGRAAYREAAERLGYELARRGIGLVYGGGGVGLMGVVADSVLERGGSAVGVIPDSLMRREFAHPALTRLETVRDIRERKARMEELSDAFIALPGGIGTVEEIVEVLSAVRRGELRKPAGLLNVDGYYDGLLHFFDAVSREGFMNGGLASVAEFAPTPGELLDRLQALSR